MDIVSICHICAFFTSDDEEYRVLLPFMKDGFDCGHKAIHVVNPDQRADHLRRLGAAGIDTMATAERGQFELRSSTETYLRDGHFDQDRMLAAFEQFASGNATHPFPLSRIVCQMDWIAEDVIDLRSQCVLHDGESYEMSRFPAGHRRNAGWRARIHGPCIWTGR